MGATVLTNRAVRVLSQLDKTLFFLYEETYEKNCYPHDPHWSMMGVFDLQAVIPALFRLVAECEGGMLQTRRGHTKPELALRAWKKAFGQATAYTGPTVLRIDQAKRNTDSPAQPLSAQDIPGFTPEQLQAWNAGESVTLTLAQDYATLTQLRERANVSYYRVFSQQHPGVPQGPVLDCRDQVFRPKRPGSQPSLPVRDWVRLPPSLQIESLYTCEPGPDGTVLRKQDWPYSIVGRFVAGYGPTELADPGHFEARVVALREALCNARVLRPQTRVQALTPDKGSGEDVKKLQAAYPEGFCLGELSEADRNALYFTQDLRLLS